MLFIHSLSWLKKAVRIYYILNDTHKEKLSFTQFSTRIAAWLLLTFSIIFTQSVKFYIFHYQVFKGTDV